MALDNRWCVCTAAIVFLFALDVFETFDLPSILVQDFGPDLLEMASQNTDEAGYYHVVARLDL